MPPRDSKVVYWGSSNESFFIAPRGSSAFAFFGVAFHRQRFSKTMANGAVVHDTIHVWDAWPIPIGVVLHF
jgi:hypothetical protein